MVVDPRRASFDLSRPDRMYPPVMSRFTAWSLLAVFGIGVLLAGLELMITATALPSILLDLAITDQIGKPAFSELRHASWIINGYLLAYVVAMPLAGRLADVWGARRLFLTALVVFIVGSLAAGRGQSIDELIAGRLARLGDAAAARRDRPRRGHRLERRPRGGARGDDLDRRRGPRRARSAPGRPGADRGRRRGDDPDGHPRVSEIGAVPRPAPLPSPRVHLGGARLAPHRLRVRDRDHRRCRVRRPRPVWRAERSALRPRITCR